MNVNEHVNRLDTKVIAIVIITKFLVLFFAVQSYQIITNQSLSEPSSYINIWNHWDATHYLNIAKNGYTGVGDDRFLIVFFPLYPALIALINLIFGSYVYSALVVSGIASIFVGLNFNNLVKLDYAEEIAHHSVFFLFIFPTSYFLHIPYTESLFLAFCISCFLFARKQKWLLVGVCGFFACLTRINGLFLLPALIFEIWSEYKETKKINKHWLFLILIPIGIVFYMELNYYITGSPTMFLTHQREHWQKYLRLPIYGIWETIKACSLGEDPLRYMMRGIQELIFVVIGLAGIVFGWKHLRPSYRVWMILNWLVFVSTSFILSVPRYTLTLFPLFILIAIAANKSFYIKLFFVVWSLLYLSLFTTQFARGWWAF